MAGDVVLDATLEGLNTDPYGSDRAASAQRPKSIGKLLAWAGISCSKPAVLSSATK
jgi:hypothetical protein